MSRSNPTDGMRNPSTRWFEWAGGSDGGYVRWYDKEKKENVPVENFAFLLLDELSTVKGWHEASESSIYANEVRDTRRDPLLVRSFKGGNLANGLYSQIRDRIVAVGGHYVVSAYIAYRDGSGELKIGNLALKGAAAGAWMDFKRNSGTKKDATGKTLPAYLVDAVKIAGYEQAKKGGTVYRIPKFVLVEASESMNLQAVGLDAELQVFLADSLKRPLAKADPGPKDPGPNEPPPLSDEDLPENDDDLPF